MMMPVGGGAANGEEHQARSAARGGADGDLEVKEECYDAEDGSGTGSARLDDALLIIRHGELRCALHGEVDLGAERLHVMAEEARLHRDAIEEEIKRAAVMRRIILLVRGELRAEVERRDKLRRQQEEQRAPAIEALEALVARRQSEAAALAAEVGRKRRMVRMRREKLAALHEEIAHATADSEADWRKGNRRLDVTHTAAERASDRVAWLATLRGGTDTATTAAALPTAAMTDIRASVAHLLQSRRLPTVVYSDADEEKDRAAAAEIASTADRLEAMVRRQREAMAKLTRKSPTPRLPPLRVAGSDAAGDVSDQLQSASAVPDAVRSCSPR